MLRREQGRLAELEEVIRRSVREFPALLRFSCALAHLYAELGRPREALGVLDELLATDLAREHLDAEWLFSVCLLPVAAASASGMPPWPARCTGCCCHTRGSTPRRRSRAPSASRTAGLGVLATALGRYDDAERHLEAAIETERRMGGRPWLAHAQHDLASMLLTRAGQGDREKARVLLAEARSTYRELGMDVWEERAAALG